LDYTDPPCPVIINREIVDRAENEADPLNKESKIIFEPQKYNFKKLQGAKSNRLSYSDRELAGMPSWMQTPVVPVCPKTGRIMHFVCQLAGGNKVLESNIELGAFDKYDKEFWESEFDHLHFWGNGTLYVFFEPLAKTACLFIQA
jgi:hypothetical protein